MPVFPAHEMPPPWCELRRFELIDMGPGEERPIARTAPRARLLVTSGTLQLRSGGGSDILKERQFFDLDDRDDWRLKGISPASGAVLLEGRWGRDMAGCGLFEVRNQENARNHGDPVDYPKSTALDRHYHDCDEYWIILSGSGTVVVGDTRHEVGAGDCVAIGMGHHHDFPVVDEPVRAVFFETTLEGQKRVGHLWEHTHGPARPKEERV